jgi:hypothetical protein
MNPPVPAESSMAMVSRFEADLLHVLDGLLGRAPISQTLSILVRRNRRPRCLSPTAVRLIEDRLGKGLLSTIARNGGWHRERHLRGDLLAEGRLWERARPESLGLTFTAQTMHWLLWLTADQPDSDPTPPDLDAERMTLGDELVVFLTFRALERTSLVERFRQTQAVRHNMLAALMFPEHIEIRDLSDPARWQRWFESPAVHMLEAWQRPLADRWVEMERSKAQIIRPERMRELGERQQAVLSAYTQACETAGRRDLLRFLWMAGRRLLDDATTIQNWIGSLDVQGLRMAERMECYRAAGVVLYHWDRLAGLRAWAESLGYFDDGYQASQLLKADWDRFDVERSLERARHLIRRLEPLSST